MKATHMTVFFTNGTTARFHDVEVTEQTDSDNLVFTYVSASDGKKNLGNLFKRTVSIVAFAEAQYEGA